MRRQNLFDLDQTRIDFLRPDAIAIEIEDLSIEKKSEQQDN